MELFMLLPDHELCRFDTSIIWIAYHMPIIASKLNEYSSTGWK